MNTSHWTALALTTLLSASALADDSTGPNNPANPNGALGTTPAEMGVPSGTGTRMQNGNTDGSAAPDMPTGSQPIKPQTYGNPEGSSMGNSNTKPDSPSSSTSKP